MIARVALVILGHELFQVSRNISNNLTLVRTLLKINQIKKFIDVKKKLKKSKVAKGKENPLKTYTKKQVAKTLLANTFTSYFLFSKPASKA